MSYRLIRVLLCDIDDCQTPSPYVLQGEDDTPLKEGWAETIIGDEKLHTCPNCVKLGRRAVRVKPISVPA